jgi:alanine racemase
MNLLRRLSRARFPYEPLITVEISRSHLLHNLDACRALAPGGKIAPILKANAYGHGLALVAGVLEHDPALRSAGAIPFFGVDSYFEAVALRAQGFKTPLLVIGYTRPVDMARSDLKDTMFGVTSLATLQELSGARRAVHIHLKIDTGMHRQGLLPEEVPAAIAILQANRLLRLDGIYTHLCDADNPDETYTEHQIAVWNRVARDLKTAFPHVRYIHAAATDGLRFSEDIESNMGRVGIGLYGLSENERMNSLVAPEPAMRVRTIVTGVKKLHTGETVGYGNTFKAPQDMTIATVPIGYSEGLDRRLSNAGAVHVGENGPVCPIVGRVSMNIITVDVSSVPDAKIGMPVTVISDRIDDPNSIQSIARISKTNTYEIAVKIPAQLKRVLVD